MIMNSDVMPSIVRMDADVLKSLLTEVKETVASVEVPEEKKNSFSVVDMWNIRRNARSASSSMRR
jgi:hypothetical protein